MQNSLTKQYIPAIVEYFIHPSLRTDPDRYYRARILIAAMLSFSVLSLTAFVAVLVIHLLPRAVLYGGAISLPTSAWFVGLLILSRRKGHFLFCSISSVLALLISIVAGISVSGGPAVSPVVQLMVMPPLTAYFFGGLRWGRYTVAGSFFALL